MKVRVAMRSRPLLNNQAQVATNVHLENSIFPAQIVARLIATRANGNFRDPNPSNLT